MTELQAKKTGSSQGLISAAFGLVIAQFIMTLFCYRDGLAEAFSWFVDFGYNINLLIGIGIMLCCGYFFGFAYNFLLNILTVQTPAPPVLHRGRAKVH